MPASKTWRVPLWVPLVIIGVSVIAIICCIKHLGSRTKARWPW